MIALLAIAVAAQAHDFWIEVKPEDKEGFRAEFNIGEAAKPEPWRLKTERVVALRSYGPESVTDHQAAIVPGEPGHATLMLSGQGTHIVTLESTPSESDLPAKEFNDYVQHEGLTAVRAWRAARDQSQAPGRELYARRAKALVQTGSPLSKSVTKPIGLTLEIVPNVHPATLRPGASLSFRLYFRGKPLAGALVRAERLTAPHAPKAVTTDAGGRGALPLAEAGRWKIATVWSVPIEGNPRAEFDTQFASLVFDLPERR